MIDFSIDEADLRRQLTRLSSELAKNFKMVLSVGALQPLGVLQLRLRLSATMQKRPRLNSKVLSCLTLTRALLS